MKDNKNVLLKVEQNSASFIKSAMCFCATRWWYISTAVHPPPYSEKKKVVTEKGRIMKQSPASKLLDACLHYIHVNRHKYLFTNWIKIIMKSDFSLIRKYIQNYPPCFLWRLTSSWCYTRETGAASPHIGSKTQVSMLYFTSTFKRLRRLFVNIKCALFF